MEQSHSGSHVPPDPQDAEVVADESDGEYASASSNTDSDVGREPIEQMPEDFWNRYSKRGRCPSPSCNRLRFENEEGLWGHCCGVCHLHHVSGRSGEVSHTEWCTVLRGYDSISYHRRADRPRKVWNHEALRFSRRITETASLRTCMIGRILL